MHRAAVLGSPISHSRSPELHRAAYAELGLDWTYEAIECNDRDFAAFFAGLDEQWRGLSLTMPLKEVVLDVVEAVETHQALPECRFRPTELLGGYGGGPENGAPARFDALLRRCAARGMGASEISASFRTETLHRARSRSLADRPRPGRADGRLRRTMGPWANFGTVDGGDESDDDGDLVSDEDIASGIDLLSTSQMLVEDDDLGDI